MTPITASINDSPAPAGSPQPSLARPPAVPERSPAPLVFDHIAPGGRIGLIALATDLNSESDLRRLLPEGVELFTNRVMNANPVTLPNLRAMAPDIVRAARGLLPGIGVDAVIYGCTSGTVAIGETELDALVAEALPGVPLTTPPRATLLALKAVEARRIAVLTPYTAPVNAHVAEWLAAAGIEVTRLDGLDMDDDQRMTALARDTLIAAATAVDHPQAEALFISCTALRAAQWVPALETALRKPVITSNQALAWHALHLLGDAGSVTGQGSLFQKPVPE